MIDPRILICARPNLFAKPGGDTGQILGLLRYLGDSAKLSLELCPEMKHVDVVHVFNLSRPIEPLIQAKHAIKFNVPVILTPIYQQLGEYNQRGRSGFGAYVHDYLGQNEKWLEMLHALYHMSNAPCLWIRQYSRAFEVMKRMGSLKYELIACAQMFIASSEGELLALKSDFGKDAIRLSEIVPVGIDPEEFTHIDKSWFVQTHGLKDFILCVARIEDLKNQLQLIHALMPIKGPLVLIGENYTFHRDYKKQVMAAAANRPQTYVLSGLIRREVLSAFAAARVHVLPSWFETTGLASLEAAASGCAIVSTNRGYAKSIFRKEAAYCDPGNPDSILQAVSQAMSRGPSKKLQEHVLSELTLENAARKMKRIYESVIAK